MIGAEIERIDPGRADRGGERRDLVRGRQQKLTVFLEPRAHNVRRFPPIGRRRQTTLAAHSKPRVSGHRVRSRELLHTSRSAATRATTCSLGAGPGTLIPCRRVASALEPSWLDAPRAPVSRPWDRGPRLALRRRVSGMRLARWRARQLPEGSTANRVAEEESPLVGMPGGPARSHRGAGRIPLLWGLSSDRRQLTRSHAPASLLIDPHVEHPVFAADRLA